MNNVFHDLTQTFDIPPVYSSRDFLIQFKKHNIFRNIEAWKNIMPEKSNQSENEQATGEKKKDLPKFDPSTDKDKANTNVSQTPNFENSITHMPAKEECQDKGGHSTPQGRREPREGVSRPRDGHDAVSAISGAAAPRANKAR
ncbi:hypothetical protein ALC56_10541 [Trachymyrmex septentrionalis]|uniref:Uncharacterized protein n=1 Tax=Trachymyrmex septentrionalis TaxID=34720 RepID=A0A151JTR5_9HYME|nr:hypothetical protein ALC56_10541 [Trachymyrmex septentrionalis]